MKPIVWTKEKGLRFAKEMITRRYLFDDFARENPALAVAMLLEKPHTAFYEVGTTDDFMGVIWLDPVITGLHACIHILLWDERALGRPELAVWAGLDACRQYDLNRVQAFIPAGNRLACLYAEKAGMLREGRMRQAVKMDGSYDDMIIYGALREEYENASVQADAEYAAR